MESIEARDLSGYFQWPKSKLVESSFSPFVDRNYFTGPTELQSSQRDGKSPHNILKEYEVFILKAFRFLVSSYEIV